MACSNSEPVNVTYVPQGANQGWNLQHCLESGGPGHYPVLSAAYDEHPTFTFNITNLPGVTFAAADPVWVQVGTAKPTAPDPALLAHIQGAGTRTLSFQDVNGGPTATLTYTLRFSNGSATDPIIQNGGCCQVATTPGGGTSGAWYASSNFWTGLVIGFAAAVILAVIIRWVRRGE